MRAFPWQFPFVALLHISLPLSVSALQTGATPQDLVLADFSGDGRTDLAVVHVFDDTLAVLHQEEGGNFVLAQVLTTGLLHASPVNAPRKVEAIDIDFDGRPDLVVLCSGNFLFGHPPSLQVFLNHGDGTFSAMDALALASSPPLEDLFPVHFVVGDFGGPVGRDLAVAMHRGAAVRILHGDGAGGYGPAGDLPLEIASEGPEFLLVVDLPGEPAPSLLAVAGGGVALLRQSAPGTFTPAEAIPLPVPAAARALAWSDFDGSGAGDLAIADENGRVILLYDFSPLPPYYSGDALLEDGSLSGPIDLAVAGSLGGVLPALAVANLSSASVTILEPEGPAQVHPVGQQPRRLATGDITGNGALDLATANQGDQGDPANEDVSFVLRGGGGGSDVPVTGGDQVPLGLALGPRLANARAISSPQPARVWVLDAGGRALREVNPNPDLNADPNARFLQSIELPYEAGGFTFVQANAYWVLERFGGRLHRYTTAQGLQQTVELDLPGDGYGLRGLARMGTNGDFFLADPRAARIHRVSAAGATVVSSDPGIPSHDLAWDSVTERLYAVHPGTSLISVYTGSLSLEDVIPMPPAGGPAFLAETGLRGIAARPNQPGFQLLTRDGLMIRADASWSLDNAVSIAPATGTLAVTVDPAGGHVYLLGADLHVARAAMDGLIDGVLYSLWPAVESDPAFLPAGMAWDASAGELLVSDRHRPVLARLDGSGGFLGFRDDTALLGNVALTGAVAIDHSASRLVYRGLFGAHPLPLAGGAKAGGGLVPLPPTGDAAFFGAAAGYLATSGLDRSRIHFTPVVEGEGQRFTISAGAGGGLRAVHVGDDGAVVLFDEGAAEEFQTFQIEFPSETEVGDWVDY